MQTLHRSRANRVLAGIFGGLGETYRLDANILRIIFVLVALTIGVVPLLILYFVAWLLIPEGGPVTLM